MHLRYQLSLLLAVVQQIYARPAQGQPKTPEAHVALCLRDGRNMADRYRREAAAFTKSNAAATDATSLAAELERFVNDYTRELETFKSRCITRPELQTTSQYQQLLSVYHGIETTLRTVAASGAQQHQAVVTQAMTAGPGGTSEDVRNRWRLRPANCRNPESNSNPPKGNGGIEEIANYIACGWRMIGVDEAAGSEHHAVQSSAYNINELRAGFVEALTNQGLAPARAMIARGMLMHACFQIDFWEHSPSRHTDPYSSWALCSQAIGASPSAEAVRAAWLQVNPGRTFEAENLAHGVRRALAIRTRVDAKMAKFEQAYPQIRKLYWQTRIEALAQHAAFRKKYAAQLAILDPMTAQVSQKLDQRLSDTCVATLQGLRQQLAKEQSAGLDGARDIGARHPLGYQITEALTLCHASQGRYAQALREAELLREGYRQVTATERAFYAIQFAVNEITRKTSPAILREDYPDIIGQHLVDYAPSTLQRFSMERLRSRAQFIKIGVEADRPAVVANVARKGDLATITFRKISWKVPDHKYGNCTRSRSPSRWRISGRYIQPEYDTSCEIIEKRWKTITYQAPTVTVPLSDADLAKPGEWVEVRINEENPNDASIVHAFAIHGRERGKQLIYYGMRLK